MRFDCVTTTKSSQHCYALSEWKQDFEWKKKSFTRRREKLVERWPTSFDCFWRFLEMWKNDFYRAVAHFSTSARCFHHKTKVNWINAFCCRTLTKVDSGLSQHAENFICAIARSTRRSHYVLHPKLVFNNTTTSDSSFCFFQFNFGLFGDESSFIAGACWSINCKLRWT